MKQLDRVLQIRTSFRPPTKGRWCGLVVYSKDKSLSNNICRWRSSHYYQSITWKNLNYRTDLHSQTPSKDQGGSSIKQSETITRIKRGEKRKHIKSWRFVVILFCISETVSGLHNSFWSKVEALLYLFLNAKKKNTQKTLNKVLIQWLRCLGGVDYFKIFIRSSLLLFYLLIKAVFLSKDENLMGRQKVIKVKVIAFIIGLNRHSLERLHHHYRARNSIPLLTWASPSYWIENPCQIEVLLSQNEWRELNLTWVEESSVEH